MSILPVFSLPSCSRIGLRTIAGSAEQLLRVPGARQLSSIGWTPLTPCRQCHGPRRFPSLSWISRQDRLPSNLLPRTQVRTVFRFRAITHYTHLPPDYEDAKGLDFRKEDLSQREVNAIFGGFISARSANQLLKIIHGRRVAGTLDDPDLQQNTSHYTIDHKTKALEYLRENIPVDEIINAGLRAEDELGALEEQDESGRGVEEEPKGSSSQSPSSEAQVEETARHTGRLPLRPKSDSPYGVSNFDKIRAENIAKREAEERRLEEERKSREEEEQTKGNTGTLQTYEQKPREMSPRMKKYMERGMSKLEAPPEMKVWERLLPSFAMTILICGIATVFAVYYQPPRNSQRLWPDVPPAAATCFGLIGINLVVWMLWKMPPLWPVLNRYFILIAATPRPLQLLGALISHQSIGHLTGNMVLLWIFGTRLHDEIGRGDFLALYFASGVVGFMVSLADLVLRRGLGATSLGASGSVYGLVAAFFWLHRFDEFKILNYPPDPLSGPQGLAFIGFLLGLHILGMFSKRGHRIDIASHLGGMAAGAVGVELVKRRMDERARVHAERMKTMDALNKIMEKTDQQAPTSPPSISMAPTPADQR